MAMSKLVKDQLNFEFVDPPTDEFNCPICLGILQEPYLTACCGNHFCEVCINKVKEGANKCPLCQETPLNGMINKGLRRKLNELKVYCMHKETGCEWIGDLGKLEHHLATGKNEGECHFVLVQCTVSDLCKVKILRKSLKHHTTNDCDYRQFKCKHCGYQSTHLVITTEHYHQCSEYPVPCPNGCTKQTYPRGQLDIHLSSCPEQEVDCTFSDMGCKEKLKRQQLQQRLSFNLLQHQMIMCQAYRSLQQDKRKLEEQVACLSYLTKDMAITAVKKINWPLYLEKMSQIASFCPVLPIILNIPIKVNEAKNTTCFQYRSFNSTYDSLPFYSHTKGYKLKLSVKFICQNSGYMGGYLHVCLNTSDTLSSNLEYSKMMYGVSVDLHIVDGEYDTQLKWPFEEKISVTLLNKQNDDQHHITHNYFKGNKASQLTLSNANNKQKDAIKQEYEYLLKNKKIDPTKLQNELWNMFGNVKKLTENSLIFPLDDDTLRNIESVIYFEIALIQ